MKTRASMLQKGLLSQSCKTRLPSGAVIANHLECAGLHLREGKASGIAARDQISGALLHVRASPDGQRHPALGRNASPAALFLARNRRASRPRKASTCWRLPYRKSSAIAVSGKGEHGFVMPWKGMSLVGTTDEAFTGDAAAAPASGGGNRQPCRKDDPPVAVGASINMQNPLASFAGVRALPGICRRHYTGPPAKSRFAITRLTAQAGSDSVFGGKWALTALAHCGTAD